MFNINIIYVCIHIRLLKVYILRKINRLILYSGLVQKNYHFVHKRVTLYSNLTSKILVLSSVININKTKIL